MLNCRCIPTVKDAIFLANIQQVQKGMLVSIAQIADDIGLNLNEGDYILVEKKDDGIFLIPVDESQRYFWTEKWQEKIKQSQQDLDNENYKSFESIEDCIKDLEELSLLSGKSDQPKTKKSLLDVVGSLKPAVNADMDIDEAIDLARTARAREIVRKMQESENE